MRVHDHKNELLMMEIYSRQSFVLHRLYKVHVVHV